MNMIEGGATHIAVATDHVIESFRNSLWPGYKTSEGVEPDLLAQFPLLEDILTAIWRWWAMQLTAIRDSRVWVRSPRLPSLRSLAISIPSLWTFASGESMPPTRVPSQRLSPASGTAPYSFARSPRSGPTSRSSTTWTSCAGKAARRASPNSQLDWTEPLPRAGVLGPWDPETGIHSTAMCGSVPRLRPKPYRQDTENHDFSPSKKHGGSGLTSDQPTVPEPSYAECARTLLRLSRR